MQFADTCIRASHTGTAMQPEPPSCLPFPRFRPVMQLGDTYSPRSKIRPALQSKPPSCLPFPRFQPDMQLVDTCYQRPQARTAMQSIRPSCHLFSSTWPAMQLEPPSCPLFPRFRQLLAIALGFGSKSLFSFCSFCWSAIVSRWCFDQESISFLLVNEKLFASYEFIRRHDIIDVPVAPPGNI